MNAMIRMGPRHVGHASGSTSKICCRSAAQRRAVGVPAIVPRRDVAPVGDVDEHPRQELERVGGLGARRRTFRLVGPVRHGLRGPVVRQPFREHPGGLLLIEQLEVHEEPEH